MFIVNCYHNLPTHICDVHHLFQVNTILTQKIDEKNNMRRESSTQKAELRSTLTHTNTNLALVEAEMARMKADYQVKCKELDR